MTCSDQCNVFFMTTSCAILWLLFRKIYAVDITQDASDFCIIPVVAFCFLEIKNPILIAKKLIDCQKEESMLLGRIPPW